MDGELETSPPFRDRPQRPEPAFHFKFSRLHSQSAQIGEASPIVRRAADLVLAENVGLTMFLRPDRCRCGVAAVDLRLA